MASKSKRRRRVFRASCILAALIIAGSSFAWFSSKDEVTNRLSASANYGVSIVEDFQPPKNFLPGQKVNKDVAVVNTGNVDAFVRTWIDGEMSLVVKSDWDNSIDADDSGATETDVSSTLTKTADDQTKLTGVNLNWYDNNKNYYKELSQIKSENPKNSTTSTEAADESTNAPARFSEVQSVQAGGVLVYHDVNATNPATDAGAEYYYVLEQATTIEGYEYDNGAFSTTKTTKTYPAGTYVCTGASVVATDTNITNKVKIPYNYYGNIDTSQFYPESEGLYIFRRNVKLNETANTADDYEYTGYYFFKADKANTTTASAKSDDIDTLDVRPRTGNDGYNPVYLALCYDTSHSQRSDYVLPDGKVVVNTGNGTTTGIPTRDEILPATLSDVKFYNATEKILTSYGTGDVLKWTYAPGAGVTTYTYTVTDDGNENAVVATVTAAKDVVKKITVNATDYYVKNNNLYSDENCTTSTTMATGYTGTGTTSTGTGAAGTGVLTASYGSSDKEIKVNIQLANLNNAPTDSTAETWSVIENTAGDNQKWTFYYNNDVEEGASTTKLIDSVELDKSVKDEAFLAFDFDLNVFMESAQVVLSETGVESGDSIVTPWANGTWADGTSANTNYNAATADVHNDDDEIDYITWAKA